LSDQETKLVRVERAVREIYDYCPPTLTHYSGQGRSTYERAWAAFLESLGLGRQAFSGATLLDVGCGSCEKAAFYNDWGARVTGLDMTHAVLEHARSVIGSRPIQLIEGSLFTTHLNQVFDIVISDGVLHHTADPFAALRWCADHTKPNGLILFSLVNVWGRFWWFGAARLIARLLGRGDLHKRARYGELLFGWTRRGQEGTAGESPFYRARSSWAYDWFANPRWALLSPAQVSRWLSSLGLAHLAAIWRALSGQGPRGMALYWLLTRQPNMMYIATRKAAPNG